MVFSIKGYHTCKDKGGIDHIRNNVPFLSRPDNQWLGQGYYFWTDSEYWARRWMNDPKVISEFSICFDKENVLDLVGDVKDQEIFQSICEIFKEEGSLYEEYEKKFGGKVTVGAIIGFLRKQNTFPYWAVRAKDKRHVSRIFFNSLGNQELFLVEPHQLCVFQEYKAQAVKFERFVHPEHYC